MNIDTNKLVEISAAITPIMLTTLAFAHGFKSVAMKLHEHALTTASKDDDKVTAKVLYVADWLDTIASAIAHVASLGYFMRGPSATTPHLEAVEAEDVEHEDPRGEP